MIKDKENKKANEEKHPENQKPEEQTEEQAADNQDVNVQDSKEKKSAKKDKSSKSRKNKKSDSGDKIAEKEKIIEELEEKYRLMNDKYLRLSAEFDNFRKRTLKEKMDLTKSAGSTIFTHMLPVIDDLERAMKMMEEANDLDAVKEGMSLIYNKFNAFLKQEGVEPIDAEGKPFDTDEHEAMTKIPAPEDDLKGKVVDVIQKGYKINDQVLRYSKVVVGE
jgi:molecular chaperone GrpE